MTSQAPSYHGYRFSPEIISHAVWLYHRFCLSFRDTEDLLAQRGITVTYETIRHWCLTFGLDYARRLRRRRGRMGDTWYLDEVFVKIHGRQQYLWRAVDEDGDVIDILVQSRRNRGAAARFFRKLLKGQGRAPRRLITASSAATPRRTAPRCRPWCTAPSSTKTIAQKSHTNQPDSASARCDGSNPLRTRNGSCRYMASCRISSGWVDTCCGRRTTGCCEPRRSSRGMR